MMRNLIRSGMVLIMAAAYPLTASLAAEPYDLDKKPASTEECKVFCVNPHSTCADGEKVLQVMETLVKALNVHDWKTYSDNLDDNCFTFDENKHKPIFGKENVVADIKKRAEKYAGEGAPFLSVTIDQPYVKVSGDSAVVTFLAIRQFGGKHPFKEQAQATDVFVKKGDTWKKCHFRGAWKRV